ncbi:uncharacterized protein obi1 isoform X2 [Esox lucius]|uniref:uncharacterized protein obi1 isoform X2 n=1 Tax=Esox lucius TaxID=8010 RepID=UPI001476EE56|nr:uncharacterized protein obi1 isoform X2 [Esox lucius]
MANNFQNVTLSLTLPISCQICLGKVRQPVICTNNHVFCSCCMDIWLKNAGQCPTCRVPITADKPCREIIGGTNENESNESHSVKKRLRKTRGELLLREYEDEIEGLLKENEDLRTRNQTLDPQLKTVLNTCTITASQRDERSTDPSILEQWSKKMRAATDRYNKIKLDVDKLKEANKMLRSQNIDLVQENMRLKAEVASRSPQKFGRCTVAALEAKIQQYQRDVDRLNKALERSDQYIEELEARGGVDGPLRQEPQGHANAGPECTSSGKEEAGTKVLRISALRRCLGDMENAPVCTSNLEGETKTLSAHHRYLLATELDASFRDRKPGRKALAYLRRLSFEDCGSPSASVPAADPKRSSLSATFPCSIGEARTSSNDMGFWGAAWQSQEPSDLTCVTLPGQSGVQQLSSSLGPGEPVLTTGSHTADHAAEEMHPMSSEASMDAAYRDKISELDSMMLEGADILSRFGSADSHLSSSSGSPVSVTSLRSGDSPGLTLQPRLDVPLVPEVEGCPVLLDADSEGVVGVNEDIDSARRLTGTGSTALPVSQSQAAAVISGSVAGRDSSVSQGLLLPTGPDASSSASQWVLLSARPDASSSVSQGLLLPAGPDASSNVSQRLLLPAGPDSSSSVSQRLLLPTGPDSSSSVSQRLLLPTGPDSSSSVSQRLLLPAEPDASSQSDELSFDLLFDPFSEGKFRHGRRFGSCADEDDDVSVGCLAGGPVGGEGTSVASCQAAKRKSHSPFNNSSPSKQSKFM